MSTLSATDKNKSLIRQQNYRSTLLPIARPNPHATAALSISPTEHLRFVLTLRKEKLNNFYKIQGKKEKDRSDETKV
jgi:hypothetical protein